ncbi:PIG-L deacetylase family protein [Microbacterium sp. W4I20]|uniref:PIG-L deacetylase family protein n=1 Tax=Microbacterium sp. W4I20 TaxID=3042262 RepID=UPI00278987AE|nr:PIG-L family deacetylase [Microbacterium sp. W4I20]MDQ0726727.1 LmbE family N-acetylglucosaminyl deacetylase [Microbacterium sp. W4I20]
MRILAIGAHPDDIDILCGGTLALYAAAGHSIVIAIATNGNVGSATLTRDQTAALRRREAERSCAVIGAELIWMDFDDEWLFDDRATRTVFIDAIRHARPDIMLVHSTGDYHPDHRIAGQVAQDARIPAAVKLVETRLPALTEIPKLYTMDTIGQLEGGLDVYVDITSVMDQKIEMAAAHVSQKAWLDHIFGMDYLEFIRSQASMRGRELGVQYAEAFRDIPTYPPSRPDLPRLGVDVNVVRTKRKQEKK